jgi:CBS domain-containing protein
MSQKVADVMTTRPHCATPESSLEEIAKIMEIEDVGSVPLVDSQDHLVGVVTDRDIVIRAIAKGKDTRGMPAGAAASRELVSVNPDQSLDEALELMAHYKVRRLPVVGEDDRLIGIVAQADIAIEAKEKKAGQVVEEVSKPRQGPRMTRGRHVA